jgi:hypothetical protein
MKKKVYEDKNLRNRNSPPTPVVKNGMYPHFKVLTEKFSQLSVNGFRLWPPRAVKLKDLRKKLGTNAWKNKERERSGKYGPKRSPEMGTF